MSVITQLAKITQLSYKGRNSRPKTVRFINSDFQYFKELSTDLFSHYENDNTVIVSIHGADDVKLNVLAIKQFFKTTTNSQVCSKLRTLKNSNKKVYVTCHSLGCYLTATCYKQLGYDYPTVMFGPFIPKIDSTTKYLASNPNIKKILYQQDLFAKELLNIKERRNVVVYSNNDLVFRTTTNGGHSIANFTKNISRDLKK